jgi:hypothetical protein
MSMAPDEVMSYAAVKIKKMVPEMIETVIGNMVPVLVETAVLKGQIELLDALIANETNSELGYLKCIQRMLVRELNHIATKEKDRG